MGCLLVKSSLLSRVDHVALANFVIAAMPICSMQNLSLLCDSIDAIIKNFIWGRKSCHWINWRYIMQPKIQGVLAFVLQGTLIAPYLTNTFGTYYTILINFGWTCYLQGT